MTYIFSSNVPEMVPFILSALLGIPLALTVTQVLLIDLGTDILPALALGTEKPEPDILQHQPRRLGQPLIDRKLLTRSFLWLGPVEAILAYSGFFLVYGLAGQGPLAGFLVDSGINRVLEAILPMNFIGAHLAALAATMFFAGVVMAQVGNAFACRSEVNRGRRLGWLTNPFLIIGVLTEIAMILVFVLFPPLANALGLIPLPAIAWLWLISYPFILYGLDWIRKSILRKSRHNGINKPEVASFESYTEVQ